MIGKDETPVFMETWGNGMLEVPAKPSGSKQPTTAANPATIGGIGRGCLA